MKCTAAVIHGVSQDWSVEEIEVDVPKASEILVRWALAGLCHSDEHVYTGDSIPPPDAMAAMGIDTIYPMIGGHEGSGIVAEVGPGVASVSVGDHVSASFVPSCGRCRDCVTGPQNLCDQGAGTFVPGMITDGTRPTPARRRHRRVAARQARHVLGVLVRRRIAGDRGRCRLAPRRRLARVVRSRTGWGLITKTYPLDDINVVYQDMRDGRNLRGVVVDG